MKRSLRRLTGIFLAMAAMIVAGIVAAFLIGQVVIANERSIISRQTTTDTLEDVLLTLSDAEAGQEGYMLTGDEKSLKRYAEAKTEIDPKLKQIDALAGDGRVAKNIAEEIGRLARERVAELDATLGVYRTLGLEAAMEPTRTNQGTMNHLRDLISAIDVEQKTLVQQEQRDAEWNTTLRNIIFSAAGMTMLLFLGWMYRRVSLEMHAREKARATAERANQAKDQFMAALSHELRTPLTPVLAMLTTWEASRELEEKHQADLQMMRRNVELEARLIDDLLDLTRVVKGKLTVNLELSDVHDILHHVEEICQSEVNAKQIRVLMHLDATHHHVRADPARLQQIFWNILRNAAKFSSEKGEVVVSTADSPDEQVEISIEDHGIGMEAGMLSRLFRPFEQGGPTITKRYGGLGLAISKALVDLQGGTLQAQSEGLGKGSRFVVRFPPAAEGASGERPAGADGRAAAPVLRNLRILLVEDHADTAKTMSRLLTNLGHQVTTAGTLAEAVEVVQRQKLDLILSDIGLPDGDGVQLLEKIRPFNKAPAIALTGFGMDEDVARTKAAGFRAHLTKPVNFQRLEMMVHQVANNPAFEEP